MLQRGGASRAVLSDVRFSAAAEARIPLSTFYRLLKKHGLH